MNRQPESRTREILRNVSGYWVYVSTWNDSAVWGHSSKTENTKESRKAMFAIYNE